VRTSLRPKSKRSQLGDVLSILARAQPTGRTDVAASLQQIAGMLRHAGLVMIFSDLLGEPELILQALYRLRHRGHDVIVFHILDEAEVHFPFDGLVELEEPETGQLLEVDASDFRPAYLEEVAEFQEIFRRECARAKIDYVPLDTSMPFDRALSEYLINRSQRS